MNKRLWEFEYAPKEWNDLIINDEIKPSLRKSLDERPNMLIYGSPGVGKGSYVDVMINHNNLKGSVLKINASLEGGIDTIRNKVLPFAQASNFELDKMKLVYINECLEENEEILMSDGSYEKISNLPKTNIKLKSYNLDTDQVENDEAYIISDKIDDCYKIEFEDGTKIMANKEHPFMVKRNGVYEEVKLKDLKPTDDILNI